jgi:hypothetical protein
MRRAAARRPLLLLALSLLATLGIRPLILPDEGRYIEVAREMQLPCAQRVFQDARKDLWRVPGRSC